jgi:SAM-dependent methyltransferase
MAGDVRGLDVLDVGPPESDHAKWLQEHGARVTFVDASERNLEEPLPQQKESVDLVFSSLVLHSVLEWEPLLREFRRVTRSGGSLVFSTYHPCRGLHDGLGVDYFSTGIVVDDRVRYYRRPLHTIVNAVIGTDWRIVKIAEPRIAEAVDPWFVIVKASR